MFMVGKIAVVNMQFPVEGPPIRGARRGWKRTRYGTTMDARLFLGSLAGRDVIAAPYNRLSALNSLIYYATCFDFPVPRLPGQW